MRRQRMAALLVACLALTLVALTACTAQTPTTPGTTGAASTTATATAAGNPLLTNEQLSDIAPGLGTLMVEIGYRNWVLYYAATGGNWELAAYQSKETSEAMEVGSTTRPARKAGLDKFLTTGLTPLNAAIAAKDTAQFKTAWDAEVKACNDCHDQQSFKYIQWKLSPTPPEDLVLTAPQ